MSRPGGRMSELDTELARARVSSSTRTVERALGLLADVAEHGGEHACPSAPAAPGSRRAPRCACCAPSRPPASSSARQPAPTSPAPGWSSSARSRSGRQSLVHQVRPSLQRIVERTGESTYFVIRGAGDTAIYLAMVEGTHAIRHTSWVGRAIELEDLAVAGRLRGERAGAGYVAQRDRLEPDVTAIAAPIRWTGGVAGALNLLGPTYRIDEPTMHGYGAIVAHEAGAISAQLGAAPSDRTTLEEVP